MVLIAQKKLLEKQKEGKNNQLSRNKSKKPYPDTGTIRQNL